ncbi:MAG: tetratricopeptide repeat protein [Bacteroidota bacterium]
MKRIVLHIAIWGYCLLSLSLFGQAHKQKVFEAYKAGDFDQWVEGIQEMEQYARERNQVPVWLDLADAKYGLIGFCIAEEKKEGLDDWINGTESILKAVLEQEPQNARAKSLYGGLLAFKIALSPAKAIYLGPRSQNYLDEAKKQDQQEPSVWVENGNMHYHAPAVFGGNMDKAIACFEKAVALYDNSSNANSWQYLHAVAWLGQAYESQDQHDKAMSVYKGVLRKHPDFEWVKDELLPACQRKVATASQENR